MNERMTAAEYRAGAATKARKPRKKTNSRRITRYDDPSCIVEDGRFTCVFPVKTVSEANQREHWRTRANRKKSQQETVEESWPVCKSRWAAWAAQSAQPWTIRMVRLGPQALDPDNLAGSFKHVQDQLCRLIGVDDGDASRVKFEYAQEPRGVLVYGVRVEAFTSGNALPRAFSWQTFLAIPCDAATRLYAHLQDSHGGREIESILPVCFGVSSLDQIPPKRLLSWLKQMRITSESPVFQYVERHAK